MLPQAVRKEAFRLLRCSHVAISACITRDGEAYWWSGMADKTKLMVANCLACREFDCQQTREPMQMQTILYRFWRNVASDIFGQDKGSYLMIVDCRSELFETDRLQTIITLKIIN